MAAERMYPGLEAGCPVHVDGFNSIEWPLCPSTWGVCYSSEKDPGIELVRREASGKKGPVPDSSRITAPVPMALFEELLAMSKPSSMGKNTKTVYDPALRRSREIPFIGQDGHPWVGTEERRVAPLVADALSKMGFGCVFRLLAHKIVLYEDGDFFAEHIDSDHGKEDLIATAVLEVALEGVPFHNCLEISEDLFTWKPAFDHEAPLSLCVMGRGVAHRVQPAKGRRLVVTYDIRSATSAWFGTTTVVPSPEKLEPITKCVREGIEVLRSAGVQKFAVLCSFMYTDNDRPLVGIDKALFDALVLVGANPETGYVAQSGDQGDFVHGEVYAHMASSDAYGALMGTKDVSSDDEEEEESSNDEEEEEGDEEEEEDGVKEQGSNKKDKGGKDEAGTGEEGDEASKSSALAEDAAEGAPQVAVGPEAPTAKRRRCASFYWKPNVSGKPNPLFAERVCMGDVCLIRHPLSRPYEKRVPRQEVHLGNEGFDSEETFLLYRTIRCTVPA